MASSALASALIRRGFEYATERELLASDPDGFPDARALAQQIVHAVGSGECCSVGELADWLLGVEGTLPERVTLHMVSRLYLSAGGATSAAPVLKARVLSFEALARARTTLSDFTKFYLPYYSLEDRDFFRWLPILVFVEACIYQLDEDNEFECQRAAKRTDQCLDPSGARDVSRGASSAENHTMHVVREVLRFHDLLCDEVEGELKAGIRYWALERQLCAAMAQQRTVDVDDVYLASSLKSFDYRVLHAVLRKLAGREKCETLQHFLKVDEMLTDFADDLCDYETDCRKNAFNVLRGLTHALGVGAPLELVTKIGHLEKEHELLLQALPEDQRRAYCANRQQAMSRAGAEKWLIPRVLLPAEERRFRDECRTAVGDTGTGKDSARTSDSTFGNTSITAAKCVGSYVEKSAKRPKYVS